MFCRETVRDLREVSGEVDDFPDVLFFFQATPEEGREFFERLWPEARAVSDPERTFYEAFGAKRGTIGQLLGPRVWGAGLRAVLKGNRAGRVVGDPWVMPGAVLVEDETVVWRHEFRHAGDRPDFREVTVGSRGGR